MGFWRLRIEAPLGRLAGAQRKTWREYVGTALISSQQLCCLAFPREAGQTINKHYQGQLRGDVVPNVGGAVTIVRTNVGQALQSCCCCVLLRYLVRTPIRLPNALVAFATCSLAACSSGWLSASRSAIPAFFQTMPTRFVKFNAWCSGQSTPR